MATECLLGCLFPPRHGINGKEAHEDGPQRRDEGEQGHYSSLKSLQRVVLTFLGRLRPLEHLGTATLTLACHVVFIDCRRDEELLPTEA